MPLFLLLSASIHSLSRCCLRALWDSHWNFMATVWDWHGWIRFTAEKHRLGASWTGGRMGWHAMNLGWDPACMFFSRIFLLSWNFNCFIYNTDNVSPSQRPPLIPKDKVTHYPPCRPFFNPLSTSWYSSQFGMVLFTFIFSDKDYTEMLALTGKNISILLTVEPQSPRQCLAHSRISRNICWVNEKTILCPPDSLNHIL